MIHPYILGSGRSGQAIANALHILAELHPEWRLNSPSRLARGSDLQACAETENPLLCIANPHGLHTETLVKAQALGIRNIVCEKPSCVSLEEVHRLRAITWDVAILHGYRNAWGVQELRRWISEGRLGDVFSLEGRYWQSSAAEKALSEKKTKGWKDDVRLAGAYDTLVDLGTHLVDLLSFLQGGALQKITGFKSYVNAESPHRDTHVQMTLAFEPRAFAFGSVSKNVHGATNDLEIHVLGSRGSAAWNFLRPDEIVLGKGRNREVVTRKASERGSRFPPFHAMGWMEGYIDIISGAIEHQFFKGPIRFPTLKENLNLLEKVFSADLQTLEI